jgi:hypothetical protein
MKILSCGNQVSTVSSVYATGQRIWDSIRGRNKRFALLQNVQTGCVAHTDWYAVGTVVLFPGYSGRSVKLTTSAEVQNDWSCTCDPPSWLGRGKLLSWYSLSVVHYTATRAVVSIVLFLTENKCFSSYAVFFSRLFTLLLFKVHGFLSAVSAAQNRVGLNGIRW